MCKRCNVKIDDTIVTLVSEKTILAWSQSITFTHAGHRFSGTFTEGLEGTYTLELENKVDEALLGSLLSDQTFLQSLFHGTREHQLREIFKTPHVFYIAEPESPTEGLSLDLPPQQ
jgi:hypothetical protein